MIYLGLMMSWKINNIIWNCISIITEKFKNIYIFRYLKREDKIKVNDDFNYFLLI